MAYNGNPFVRYKKPHKFMAYKGNPFNSILHFFLRTMGISFDATKFVACNKGIPVVRDKSAHCAASRAWKYPMYIESLHPGENLPKRGRVVALRFHSAGAKRE